jgi:phytoene synthase
MPAADLARSQTHCLRVARRAARNFYYGFYPLSREQHAAMCAVYAFARRADDLADDEGSLTTEARRRALAEWRRSLDKAMGGDCGDDPVLPAVRHAIQRFSIPSQYFHDLIAGVSTDLDPPRYETFADLYCYCRLVASSIGLICLHIFGFESPEAPQLAEKLGVAFQLTNILRDQGEDAARGRFYWPAEDLRRFAVSPADFEARRLARLRPLLEFEAARAESYYRQSAPLLDLVHPRSRASLWILTAIYHGILERIRSSGFDVFSRRAGLSAVTKTAILLRGLRVHLMGGQASFPA